MGPLSGFDPTQIQLKKIVQPVKAAEAESITTMSSSLPTSTAKMLITPLQARKSMGTMSAFGASPLRLGNKEARGLESEVLQSSSLPPRPQLPAVLSGSSSQTPLPPGGILPPPPPSASVSFPPPPAFLSSSTPSSGFPPPPSVMGTGSQSLPPTPLVPIVVMDEKEKQKTSATLQKFFKKRATREELVSMGILSDDQYKEVAFRKLHQSDESKSSSSDHLQEIEKVKMQKGTVCMNSRCNKKLDLFSGKVTNCFVLSSFLFIDHQIMFGHAEPL